MKTKGKRTNDIQATDMIKNLEAIKTKINYFRKVIADNTREDQHQQICLSCRSAYGLVVQSLAWAEDREVQPVYDLIPDLIELAEAGLEILRPVGTPKAIRLAESVEAKSKSLISILETKDLEKLFDAIA